MDWHMLWSQEQPVRRLDPVWCAIKAWRIETRTGPVYDSVAVAEPRSTQEFSLELPPASVEESSARSLDRALPRRDITVPMGHFRTPAIS